MGSSSSTVVSISLVMTGPTVSEELDYRQSDKEQTHAQHLGAFLRATEAVHPTFETAGCDAMFAPARNITKHKA